MNKELTDLEQDPVAKLLQNARLELYYWQFFESDSFSARLYQLFAKADLGNKTRLAIGFPHHYIVFCEWSASKDPIAYFEQHQIRVRSSNREALKND